jgi:anti-sigma factor RsiW
VRHPTPGELLELHFGELDEARGAAGRAHARDCVACAAVLAELQWTEAALAELPAQAPPADGLDRVLARIETVRPARRRRAHWLRTAAPCAAAVLGGSVAVQQGGAVAALAFFALGSIVTLALAPVLILESQRRS